MEQNQKELRESDFLKIIWDYFSIHARQRIQILNFYIILETFFITALLTVFQLKGEWTIFCVILSVAIIFFSFIFYALDTRTKDMIKFSENALKAVEQKYIVEYGKDIMIFSIEQEKTLYERRWSWLTKKCLSYTKLFRLIYIFFTVIGGLGLIWAVLAK